MKLINQLISWLVDFQEQSHGPLDKILIYSVVKKRNPSTDQWAIQLSA